MFRKTFSRKSSQCRKRKKDPLSSKNATRGGKKERETFLFSKKVAEFQKTLMSRFAISVFIKGPTAACWGSTHSNQLLGQVLLNLTVPKNVEWGLLLFS